MRKKTALYASSFDPFTLGHADSISRALKLFDELTIVIAVSPSKKPLLTKEQRTEMLLELFKDNPSVKVDSCDGLIVDFAKDKKIDAMVRGLRPIGDFDLEFQMASINKKLLPDLETVFFMTGDNLYYVSSSIVKEVYNHGGDVSKFVPEQVLDYLNKTRC